VNLEDGSTFELLSHDTDVVLPVDELDLTQLKASACEEPYLVSCIGMTILEVLKSDYWPSTGLLMSNDYFLYTRDIPNRNRSGALLIGPFAEKVGERYSLDEVAPYWG
jgi:hypothetical protein